MFIDVFTIKKCEGSPEKNEKKNSIFSIAETSDRKNDNTPYFYKGLYDSRVISRGSQVWRNGVLVFSIRSCSGSEKKNKYPTWSETYLKALVIVLVRLSEHLLKKSFSIHFL